MNDPNGLSFVDGRWHAFYQHHPFDDHWGPMHWGHASSTELLHWEHHPIALAPDEHGTIFSGSVVQDLDGTAGFGAGALVALFTHHAGDRQHQSVAHSTDGGMTWQTYADNPVLIGAGPDFRDPKVIRLADGHWSMVVTKRDHLAFYESADLLHWEPVGEFRADLGAQLRVRDVGAWECPDLVEIARDRSSTWLLTVGLFSGGEHGHSTTVVIPGSFGAGEFTPSEAATRMDHGPDFYAFQTFSGVAPSPPVGMAWMSSWAYANDVPSAGIRGMLSIPRRLALGADGAIRSWPAMHRPSSLPASVAWIESTDDVVVDILGSAGTVRAGVADGAAFVERLGDHVPGYAGRHEVAISTPGPHLVIVDHGSVEVFAGGGAASVTAQVFAGPICEVVVHNP
jgi:sucrose-6-phosphate hydrolase SacC (GH32 family)